jgi:hypothetical protein
MKMSNKVGGTTAKQEEWRSMERSIEVKGGVMKWEEH